MRVKESRGLSFVIVGAVYVLAVVFGYFVFNSVPGHILKRLFIADVASTVLVFIFSCIFGNASVYDPYWSVQPIVILAPFAFSSSSASKTFLLAMIVFWGTRLTANWAYTFHGLDHQDWRYSQLREQTGWLYPFVNLAGIHMFPTLVVFACITPAVFVMTENPTFSILCLAGFAISTGAVVLQLIADAQMQKYRADRKTPFMEEGLWKYSMHPNYLGEILMWWGVAIYSICLLGFRWYLIVGAVVNNLMFLFISIPMADRRQSRKPGYEEYRQGKNHLVPIRLKRQ